jgi:hypothetical protein
LPVGASGTAEASGVVISDPDPLADLPALDVAIAKDPRGRVAATAAYADALWAKTMDGDADAKGERWQFYFAKAFDGKNKAWAEEYATAQVRREQEEAERIGSEPADPAFLAELDAVETEMEAENQNRQC